MDDASLQPVRSLFVQQVTLGEHIDARERPLDDFPLLGRGRFGEDVVEPLQRRDRPVYHFIYFRESLPLRLLCCLASLLP